MQRDADTFLSNNEKDFIIQARPCTGAAPPAPWCIICLKYAKHWPAISSPGSAMRNRVAGLCVQALKEERRVDGRGPYELREPKFQVRAPRSGLSLQAPRSGQPSLLRCSSRARPP
jgi:hypothetical protein